MDNIEENLGENLNSHNEYNDEPVYYCKHCLSLSVRDAGLPDLLYCDTCGSSEVDITDIYTWESLYKEKYGFKLLDKNYNK